MCAGIRRGMDCMKRRIHRSKPTIATVAAQQSPARARDDAPRVERLAVTIEEAQQMLGVRRSTVYVLMGEQKVVALKIGRRTLVTTASIRDFLANLPRAQIAGPKAVA